MNAASRLLATICLTTLCNPGPLRGADPAKANSAPVDRETVVRAIEIIVSQHANAPAPQQLALIAARSYLRHSDRPPRLDLAQRAWKLNDSVDISGFLKTLETEVGETGSGIWGRVLNEIGEHVRGRIMPLRDAAVSESLASNLYVGIGIILSTVDHFPTMMKVFEDGPAHRAGAVDRDRILSIDGEDTRDWTTRKSIDMLRGPRGSDVTVVLRAANSEETRTYTITRDVVPLKSVEPLTIGTEAERNIGYAKISSIRSSTVHELRTLEREAVEKGVRALVLDLRRNFGGRVHDTVLLADAFLDAGSAIGSTRSASGAHEYTAEANRIFRQIPVAILIDNSTNGLAEWLAAALKRHRAVILVGRPTAGHLNARQNFPIPDSDWVIDIPHVLLEGPGGEVLATSADEERIAAAFPEPRLMSRAIPGSGIVPDVELRRNPTDPPLEIADRLFLEAAIVALRKKLEN